jgi:DNA helicase-2/ATP-dependent DNA helicase PcrA
VEKAIWYKVEEFLNQLNESQRDAVLYNDGPSLVIAGAGSGKTRVLTYKIACLLKQGVSPSSVLALTFTNKAAREMKERIASIVGYSTANRLWMGTFHSIFYRILRMEADKIGFPENFTIYDSSDSKNLIRTIVKESKLDDKIYKATKVHARISQLKNNLVTPAVYQTRNDLHDADMRAKMPLLKDIYSTYFNRCRQAGVMDFDDLLLYTNLLFRDHPGTLAKYQNYFKFILVDEYQDTNFAQHLIVKKLAERHHRVCVVGDDAQSIYSFRGANIENILRFKENYPESKIFKLERNYRSTRNIVKAANSLIEKNKEQIKKNVYSEEDEGNRIKVLSAYSDLEESAIIANAIYALKSRNNYEYNDFAILYRTNAQSRSLEEALRKKNIPYKIFGGLSFYQRKEIKDIIAYFRLVVNPDDEEAFKRIINYPARGIGNTTVGKIAETAAMHHVSYWAVISDPLHYNLSINAGTATKLAGFKQLMDEFIAELPVKDAYELADHIIKKSGIQNEIFQDFSPEDLTRQQNLEELRNGIYEFCNMKKEEDGDTHCSLVNFLQEVSLLTDQDTDNGENNNKVTLMTVHASKGLEFKNIFIAGMEEELFPSNMSTGTPEGIEEERRLFYVAITRAEENCFVTYAKSRFRNGSSSICNPSRFLKDIDSELLDLPDDYKLLHGRVGLQDSFSPFENSYKERSNFNLKINRKKTETPPPPPRFKATFTSIQQTGNNAAPLLNMEIKPGSFVEHEKFGIGKIIDIEGSGSNSKATILFKNSGEKKILLKYAKMKIIE